MTTKDRDKLETVPATMLASCPHCRFVNTYICEYETQVVCRICQGRFIIALPKSLADARKKANNAVSIAAAMLKKHTNPDAKIISNRCPHCHMVNDHQAAVGDLVHCAYCDNSYWLRRGNIRRIIDPPRTITDAKGTMHLEPNAPFKEEGGAE